MNITTTDWYNELIEEAKDIVTESVFTSRWALVEGYHLLGERIRNDGNFQEHAKGNSKAVQSLAQDAGISKRMIYYALKFYDKYPVLDKVPEGKNVSMNKLITKYLTEPKETPEFKERACQHCGKTHKCSTTT